ncbi:peptidase C13 family protein [Acinetobacter qingfengensis]|uniref:Peptidase C13 family protein n=1 Tax=Acinetobacter qingfengensis TaxID=1262585 RepID=A0A1E7RF83_9GAMM|nr:C13 family peptidase [Acinetobacter qingfengensis]KAA8731859.1 peptidase C13 family protein [Acinetobacter qingfengensis]OEY98018.1 peptidase C13 family protein [Acinetobacter qingfengensis]
MIEIKATPSFWRNLKNNQIAGMWLFVGSRRSLKWVAPTALQLIVWVIAGCLANTLFSWLVSGAQGHFNAQGLVSYLLWPFLALIAGVFLSQRMDLQRVTLVPALLWVILDVHVALLQSFLQYLGTIDLLPDFAYNILPNLFMVLFVWQSGAVVWVFSRELNWPWWERVLILLTTLITLVVWQGVVKSQPIWKIEEVQPTITEKALYAQSDLLNRDLQALQPSNFIDTQWYFLGIAGASYQDVFRSEVERIKDQFDMRFGTIGHSMALINNDATSETLPMATHISIERSLKRIGSLINRENDVAFIYMTSHGLPNQFELSDDPVAMDPIDPKWLRQTLDAAGIRWRVIVISSCYSGSFIPVLKSPDTLIITASAADRSSFGCSNEADYTYFGRAFFDEAMRENNTLETAFLQAQKTVAKWEKAQGFEPSEPQWVIGENMKLMLPQLERQLFPQKTLAVPESPSVFLDTGKNTAAASQPVSIKVALGN